MVNGVFTMASAEATYREWSLGVTRIQRTIIAGPGDGMLWRSGAARRALRMPVEYRCDHMPLSAGARRPPLFALAGIG